MRRSYNILMIFTVIVVFALIYILKEMEIEPRFPAGSEVHKLAHQCTRKKMNLYHIKVQKTGSTTATEIILKFAFNHNLNIVPKGQCRDSSDCKNALKSANYTFNVLSEHTDLDENFVSLEMPQGTAYIGSIRHPFTQTESFLIWTFKRKVEGTKMDLLLGTNQDDLMKKFLEFPGKKKQFSKFRNVMSRRFGMDMNEQDNLEYIEKFVKHLDSILDIMIINEYYDESLVLMRRKLCWSLKDIVYLSRKTAKYDSLVPTKKQNETSRQFSNADYMLYDHFLKKFFISIKEEKHFQDEVQYFKQMNEKVNEFCLKIYNSDLSTDDLIKSILNDELKISFTNNPWSEDFTIFGIECLFMKLHVDLFRNALFVKKMPGLCDRRIKASASPNNNIFILSNNVKMWPGYCKNIYPTYNISLEVLKLSLDYDEKKMDNISYL